MYKLPPGKVIRGDGIKPVVGKVRWPHQFCLGSTPNLATSRPNLATALATDLATALATALPIQPLHRRALMAGFEVGVGEVALPLRHC